MTDKYTPAKGDYITLQGKKYLPARRRVQWFRGDHPDWTITTSVVELNWQDGHAIIRADILDDTGRLISSGMKSETRKGFADFVEKAETGAIARAVAIAGYGTEDALDLDEGERIADSPVSQPEQRGAKASSPRAAPAPRTPEENAMLSELVAVPGMSEARASLLADAVGVVKGERATADQLREMLSRATTPPSDAGTSEAATTQGSEDAASPGASSDPAPAPTFDDVLRVSGGVEVPPAPGTPEYRALPNGVARAAAKAYHEGKQIGEALAEQLGAPLA